MPKFSAVFTRPDAEVVLPDPVDDRPGPSADSRATTSHLARPSRLRAAPAGKGGRHAGTPGSTFRAVSGMSYRPRLSTNVGRGLAESSITITDGDRLLVLFLRLARASRPAFLSPLPWPRRSRRRARCSRCGPRRRRQLDQGRHIAASLGVYPLFVDAVEEAEELVELGLRDRVELVVVAAGAAHRQAEEDHRRRLDPVDTVLDAPFLLDRAGLGDGPVIAVEPGGDPLRPGRPRAAGRRQSARSRSGRTAGCG